MIPLNQYFKVLNLFELTLGFAVFSIIRQFTELDVNILFLIPVIMLAMIPSGRFKEPIITKKNYFDLIYSFFGILMILVILFTDYTSEESLSGEIYSVGYMIGSSSFPVENLALLNQKTTGYLSIIFFSVIPVISIGYTVIKNYVNNKVDDKRYSHKKKRMNIFERHDNKF